MRRSLLIFLCLSLAACATQQTEALLRAQSAAKVGAIQNPVFFAQSDKQCGPAALAMVLAQSGVAVTPEALSEEVYSPGREGTLTPDVLAAARRRGRIAYPVETLPALIAEIDAGRPVLVLQNLGLSWFPQWHYAVAVGYDLVERTLTLHSGTREFLRMPLSTFERTWSRGENWAIVILRPGEFPREVNESLYVTAAAGIERAGRLDVAADAYAAAVERWPDNPVALMGQGNALYGLSKSRAAAAAFRLATQRLPANADAFNNLGHVLADLGEFNAAREAAQTAIALAGPNVEIYRDTLRAIESRQAAATP